MTVAVPSVRVRGLLTSVSFVLCLFRASSLPVVDPGLFVISGVMTCGEGNGYCLLGMDCTLDADFLPDPRGHCEGLKNAFTPSAYFTCCKANDMRPGPSYGTYPQTTTTDGPRPTTDVPRPTTDGPRPSIDGPKTPLPSPTNASYTQINSTPVSTTPLAQVPVAAVSTSDRVTENTETSESISTGANTQTTGPPPTQSPGVPATRQSNDVTEMTSDATEQSTLEGEFSYPPLRENSLDMEDREGSGSRKTGGMSEGTTAKVTISLHEPDLTATPGTDVFEETYVDDGVDEQAPEEMPEEQDSVLFEQDEEENEEGDEEQDQEAEGLDLYPFNREAEGKPSPRPEVNDVEQEIYKVRPEMSEVRPGSKGQEMLMIQGPEEKWQEVMRPSSGMTEMQPVKTEIQSQAGARPMVNKVHPIRPEMTAEPQVTEMLPVATQSPPTKISNIRPLISENRVANDSQVNIVRIRPMMTEVRPETYDSEVHGTRIQLPKKDLAETDLIDDYAEENEYEMDLVSPEHPSMIEIPFSTHGPKEPITPSTEHPFDGHKSGILNSGHPMSHPDILSVHFPPIRTSSEPAHPAVYLNGVGHPMGTENPKGPGHEPIPVNGVGYPMGTENMKGPGLGPIPVNGIGYPMGIENPKAPGLGPIPVNGVGYPMGTENLKRPGLGPIPVNGVGYPMGTENPKGPGLGPMPGYPDIAGEPESLDDAGLPLEHEKPVVTPEYGMSPGQVTSESPLESSTEDLAVSKTYLNFIRDKINSTIAEISTSLNDRFPGLRPGIISNTISDVVAATQRPFLPQSQSQSPLLNDGSSELFNRDNASASAFSRPRNCDMVRDVEWRFQEDDHTMCYGILIDAVRILTSASCVLKLFESNMAGVSAISNRGNNHSINGVTVHENFQAVNNPQAMNKNDLGIVTLKATVPYNDQCIPKLPFKGQILRNMKCSSTHDEENSEYKTKPMLGRYSSNYMNRDSPLCSHSLSTFEVNRTPYLTLACQNAITADTRKISQDTSGSGVMCDGILAGIELSSGLGAKAYTPLSMYVDWINKNIKGPSISQRFRVGYYNFKK